MKNKIIAIVIISFVLVSNIICKESVLAKDEIEAAQSAENIVVSGTTNSGSAWIWVLKPMDITDGLPEKSEIIDYANSITESNFNEYVIKAYAINVNEDFSLSIPVDGMPEGFYIVKVIFDENASDDIDYVRGVYYLPALKEIDIVEAVNGNEDVYDIVVNQYPIVFNHYVDAVENIGNDFNKFFAIAKKGMTDGTFSGSEQNIEHISDVSKAIINTFTLAEMYNNNSFTQSENYKIAGFEKLFSVDYQGAEFETAFNMIKGNPSTVEEFINDVEKSKALSLILNGSYDEVKTAITKYKAVLKIPDKLFKDSNALSIAKKLSTDYDSVKGYANDIVKPIEKIIKDLSKDGAILQGPSGGGVGGGGVSNTPVVDEITPIEPTVTETFTDLYGFEWAKEAILSLFENGIVSGDGNNRFIPDGEIKREEAAKMLVKMLKLENAVVEDPMFDDCDINEWYYPYIAIAKTNAIVLGESNKSFGIGKSITRQDFAVMISRCTKGMEFPAEISDKTITDSAEIAGYAKTAVLNLVKRGIISGYEDGSFRPNNSISRAEAAILVNKIMNLGGNEQ